MSVEVGSRIGLTGSLVVEACPSCGVIYAIPQALYDQAQRYKKNKSIYCPNGHGWHYTGKTHEQELRELRDALALAHANEEQAVAGERMAVAREAKERKAKERLQKRAVAGVCPCCHRTFKQLAAHMKTKHPDYAVQA